MCFTYFFNLLADENSFKSKFTIFFGGDKYHLLHKF